MSTPDALLREMRFAAGFSQRDLARQAGTSQPAIARYERGVSVPAWDTLQRLAAACGRRLTIEVEAIPDPHDVALSRSLLELTPLERLRSLRRFTLLHGLARVGDG